MGEIIKQISKNAFDRKIITFRDVNTSDAVLMRDWIKSNEFTRHWYFFDKIPKIKTIERIIIKHNNEPRTISKIILIDNIPIGYIQSYPVDGNGAWSNKVKIKDNTASLDYYIGDLNYIHKGYGKLIIEEYINQFVIPEKYTSIMISPDPNNYAQQRLCEKLGLKLVKIVNVPYKNSKEKEAVYFKEFYKN